MKIKTFGAKHFTGQLPRIEEGFKELGHEIVDGGGEVHFVYANDENGIREAADWLNRTSNYPKIVFNLLDVPQHLFPNYNLREVALLLTRADAVTSISKTTQADMRRFLKVESTVIYQPTMPIYETGERKYDYKYLIVGRNSDANKRNDLLLHYFHKFEPNTTLAVLGSEPWRYGDYFGVVPNDVLNDFYNSCQFVFSLTKYGGIELSQIEAVLAGKFPIVCNDSEVAMEFNPEFACDPTPEGINKKIIEISENQVKYIEIVKEKQKDFTEKFDKVNVAKRILKLVE